LAGAGRIWAIAPLAQIKLKPAVEQASTLESRMAASIPLFRIWKRRRPDDVKANLDGLKRRRDLA
jgi:hypothetical protein